MKRTIILSVAFLFFCLPAALFAQDFGFVVNGKIGRLSAPAKAWLLSTKNGAIHEDSAVLKRGAFRLRGTVEHKDEQVLLVVSKSGNRRAMNAYMQLYIDAKTISIVSPDSLGNAIVTGGTLNRDRMALNAAIGPVEKKIRAANQDEDALDEEGLALKKEEKAVYLNFIKTHPNSIISFDALDKFGGRIPDAREVEPVFNLLSDSIRSTKKGQEYAAKIAVLRPTVIGHAAPDFTMPDTSGHPVSLYDFKGKYVLLDFWASWCPPCRAENVNVVEAFKKYQSRNFTVLSVTLDHPDQRNKWLAAIQKDQLTWAQVIEPDASNNPAAKLYSVSVIPQNFLIDPDGKIIAKNLRGTGLENKLREILGN
ncbi:MAG: AhpC/TSA family protein [Bacteroidetes bacterium]|nr:AhpC/TSA family protein [Bacteroidota bacterium]